MNRMVFSIFCLCLSLCGTSLAALTDGERQRGAEATARLNLYRRLSGLPDVVLDETLSVGCSNHAAYLDLNPNQVFIESDGHNEYPTRPGYTTEGAEAGPKSDIAFGEMGTESVDVWYRTYYHRSPMVNRGVVKVGYGDNPGNNFGYLIAVLRFQTYTLPTSMLTPGHGSDGCATMGNAENNDPVPGFGDSMGNPIIAYFSGSKVSWQSSTVTANGQILLHQVVAPNSSANPYRGSNEICLITNSVLPKTTVISVSISFSQDGISKVLQWNFKTSSSGLFDPVSATASLPNVRSNNPPVVSGTSIVPNSPKPNETVSFSASVSDPDGNPLSYSWNFGDGGQASGASTTHSYGSLGTFSVVLTVSDDKGGSVLARAYVSVVNPVNRSPIIASSPMAQPLDPTVAQDVLFSVSASDPDGDALSYSWDFGDGCSVVGCPVSHSYQLTTSYNVVVVVSDGRGGSATSSLVVTVRQSSISDTDTDGDGFPDEIETEVGSNFQDQNSTPFGWTAVTGTPTVNSLLVKLNFGTTNRDNLRISGSFPLDSEMLLENQPVVVDIGGVIKAFVLDTKGSNTPKSRTESIKIRICNVSGQPTAKFSAKFIGDLDDKFAEEGLSNADVTGQARIPVIILIGQKVFRKDLNGDYIAKRGRKGTWTTSR